MKVTFLLSLVAAAGAANTFTTNLFNTQYVKAVNGLCVVQPGYNLFCLSAAPPASTTVTASTTNVVTCNAVVTAATLTATQCGAAASTWFVVNCATNYTTSGLTSPNTQAYSATDATPYWDSTQPAIAGYNGPVDFSLAGISCQPYIPPACNYTCTTTGTGSGCNASGTAAVGALPQSLCNAGYFATVTSPSTATTSCPAGGLNVTWVVTCSNVATAYTTTQQWFLIASAQRGWSEPKSCNCATDPVCPSKNSNSPTCSKCNLSPCVQTNAGWGTPGAVRVNQFAAAAFCPAGTTTLAGMYDCFEQAACGGAIAKGDICIFGVANQAGTAPCPTCPSGSKKGLLGLLGLLGLIPLLLCSSLLCLLLFCIRRNKKERDVHFATFDAGAPAVVAPVCHDFPVAHQTQTVHHATYVGPQHCAVPSGFGY